MIKILKRSILSAMFLLMVSASSNAQTLCFAQFSFSPNPNGTSGIVFTPVIQNTPGVTYNWSFGDGTTSNQMNPTHTYQQSGTYTACLIVWYQNCSDTSCVTVTVGTGGGGNCQASFTSVLDSITGPYCYDFTNTSVPLFAHEYWDFGDGTTSNLANPSHCFPGPGCYIVCLSIYDSIAQCWDQTCMTIIIHGGGSGPCQANFSSTVQPNSLTVGFNDNSTGNPYNWFWDFGDNQVSNQQNPVHQYSQPGVYVVCLTITATNSPLGPVCTSTLCDTIIVTASGGGPCFDPSAIDSNIVCTTLYNPVCGCDSITYSNACVAYYQHGITSWTAGPCGNTPPTPCSVQFQYSMQGTATSAFFFANSTGSINSWHWDFGDGTSAIGPTTAHTYANSGTYTVCLIGVDINNPACADTVCQVITIGGGSGCQANFSYTPDSTGYAITFNDNSTGSIVAWNWSFPGGVFPTSQQQNPIVIYNAPGVYQACLTVTDTANNCTSTTCQTITIGSSTGNCQSLFSVTPDSSGYVFYFSDQSLGNITQWTWTFPGGTPSGSSAQNPTVAYNTPGIYQVCLVVYDSISGCTSTSCQTITVGSSTGNCHANFSANQTAGAPFTVFFNDASLGMITSWSWDFGDNSTGTGQNPVHTYNAPGTYIVCLTVVAATPIGVNCTSTYCDTIVVTQGGGGTCIDPTVIDTSVVCPTVVNPVCGCDSVTYQNSCIAYYYHGVTQWTPGPCGQSNPCSAAFQYTTTGTGNSFMFFNGSSGNITSFQWSFGDGTGSTLQNPTHTYTTAGTYQVCLIVSNFLTNCTDTFCLTVTVTIGGGGCQASFNTVPDSTGFGISFINTSSGNPASNFVYHWDFGDGTTSNVASPFHQYSNAGIYLVCLTITDNTGCTDTYCHVVNVTAGNPCAPTFYMFPDSLIFGSGTVHFIGINNCNVQSWYWTFGDSTSSTVQNPIHQYNQTGWYWVCVNVTLFNGTTFQHCDSIYALRLFGTGITEEIVDNLELKNYPNPFENNTYVSYQLVGNANVEMSVYNLLGEKITGIVDQQQSAGQYTFEWDATPYNSGLYILRLTVNDHAITRKLSLVK